MKLQKASRKRSKLRIGMSGVSGSGKTYSALLLAYGIVKDWNKIVVIDTEQSSSELYSDLGEYNVLPLQEPFSPQRYCEAIKACVDAGMQMIIIDSVSHEWDGPGGCLEIHHNLGGKFQDWGKVTPLHKKFLDTILQAPCHVITTTRRKQEYALTDSGGKKRVEKLGLKEVQRDGFEYELTVAFDISINHMAIASKDRTGLFKDANPFLISTQTGELLTKWNDSGKQIVDKPKKTVDNSKKEETKQQDDLVDKSHVKKLFSVASECDWSTAQLKQEIMQRYKTDTSSALTIKQYGELIELMKRAK